MNPLETLDETPEMEYPEIGVSALTQKSRELLARRLDLATRLEVGQRILFESRGKLCMGTINQITKNEQGRPIFLVGEVEGRPPTPTPMPLHVHWYEVSSVVSIEKFAEFEVGQFVLWRDEDLGKIRRGQIRSINNTDGPYAPSENGRSRLSFTILPYQEDGSLTEAAVKQVPDYRIMGVTFPPVAGYRPFIGTFSRRK